MVPLDTYRSIRGAALLFLTGILSLPVSSPAQSKAGETPNKQQDNREADDNSDSKQTNANKQNPESEKSKSGQTESDNGKASEDGGSTSGEKPSNEPSDLVKAARKKGLSGSDIKAFGEAYSNHSNELQSYVDTVDSAIKAEFLKQRTKIRRRYQTRIDKLKTVEQNRRTEAIESIQTFLDENPSAPEYTPDAMFRLAELQFEQTNAEYQRQNEKFRKQLDKYQNGERAARPKPPRKDYSESLELFRRLVNQWPDYEQVDGAKYLLAYITQQTGEPKKARQLFEELIANYPESQFVPEAWLRIGEYYFQYARGEKLIKKARRAYREAAEYPKSKFYDKALYKLAWTNYRLNDYGKAVERFRELVEYSDAQTEAGKSKSVLREEAVQYIAVSLARGDWDLDGSLDAGFVLPRTKRFIDGEKPYGREVLVELANYLFEDDLYRQQTKVLEFALESYPLHPGNPKLHEKLILGLTKADKLKRAFAVRNKLGKFYDRDSKWYKAQKEKGHYKAIDRAERLVKKNLLGSAKWYHQRAQKLRQKSSSEPQKLAKARDLYEKAASGYLHFIKKYPHWDNIVKLNLHYADALFYSGQSKKAFEQYEAIREFDTENNPYREESAFKAIKAMEQHLVQLQNQGDVGPWLQLENRQKSVRQTAESQTKKDDKTEQKTQKEKKKCGDLPEAARRYITAMDRYIVLRLDNGEAPERPLRLAFQSGKVFYDKTCFEPAIARFEWLVENKPDSEYAFLAASLILESYRQQEKYKKLAEWANRLDNIIKGEQAAAIKAEVQRFKLGAMFKSARQLQNNEEYEKAAEEYLRLVNKNPEHKFAAKALNNAAVAYEQIHKYESAMELYRRVYRDYRESPLAAYSLYRVGVNAERFFNFENALETYMDFYREFEGAGSEELEKLDFNVSDKRSTALKSAAVLAENLQKYSRAARLYEQFVETYPSRDETAKVQWNAIQNWKKAEKPRSMIEAIKAYREQFGGLPENTPKVMEGLMMIAEHYRRDNQPEQAAKWYNNIIDTYEKRGLEAGSASARYAAEAQFRMSERAFAEWRDIKLKGSLEQQKQNLQDKIKGSQKVSKKYQKVFNYKSLEWTLAAGYRIGSLFKNFADTLYEAPIPFDKGTQEYRVYRQELENRAMPIEDKAVSHFKKTLSKARNENIVNEWTKKTLEALNKFRPGEYPLYKESLKAVQTSPVSGAGLIGLVDYQAEGSGDSGDSGGSGDSGDSGNSGDSGESTDSSASKSKTSEGDSAEDSAAEESDSEQSGTSNEDNEETTGSEADSGEDAPEEPNSPSSDKSSNSDSSSASSESEGESS